MKYKLRKKYQREVNKAVRNLNRVIEKDELWKGRFYFFQMASDWEEFPDNSGGILRVIIRAYDKQNGYYKDYFYNYAPWMLARIWNLHVEIANEFITEADYDVWRKQDPPKVATSIDYRNERPDVNKLHKGKPNWYISENYFEDNGYVRM